MKAYTLQDMERAWAEGHRTCYEGGGEESNPYIEKGRDASPKSVTAEEPQQRGDSVNHSTKTPHTMRELGDMAEARGITASALLKELFPEARASQTTSPQG